MVTARPVEVTVGAIVLEGISLRDGDAFGEAVGSALTRLVTLRGLPSVGTQAAPVAFAHDPGAGDRALAESVAGAIWSSLRSDAIEVHEQLFSDAGGGA